jgi:hypothetical protein
MKTMKKQRGFFAVLAVTLLVTAVLITNCMDPMSGSVVNGGNGDNDNFRAPAGKGVIKLKLGSDERTVLPTIDATLASYTFYVLVTDAGSNTVLERGEITPVTLGTATGIIILPVDETDGYDIQVIAYNGLGPVGSGTATGVLVSNGGTTNTTINLKGNTGSGDDGILTWTIGLPTNLGAGTAELVIYEYGQPTASDTITLPGTGTTDLSPGFYRVDIVFTPPAPYLVQPKTISRIVHIYENLTSNLAYSSGPLNRYAYNLDLRWVNGIANDTTNTAVPHGSPLPAAYDPTNMTHNDGVTDFLGWYRTYAIVAGNGVFSDPFDYDDDKIFNDLILFAKWDAIPPAEGNINLTITYTVGNPTLTFSPTTVSVKQNFLPNSVALEQTIEFTAPTGTLSNIAWLYNSTATPVSTTNQLIVNSVNAHDALKNPPVGDHEVTITFELDGTVYSGEFTFTIVP